MICYHVFSKLKSSYLKQNKENAMRTVAILILTVAVSLTPAVAQGFLDIPATGAWVKVQDDPMVGHPFGATENADRPDQLSRWRKPDQLLSDSFRLLGWHGFVIRDQARKPTRLGHGLQWQRGNWNLHVARESPKTSSRGRSAPEALTTTRT
jgi:hypothetical protein